MQCSTKKKGQFRFMVIRFDFDDFEGSLPFSAKIGGLPFEKKIKIKIKIKTAINKSIIILLLHFKIIIIIVISTNNHTDI